MDEKYLLINNKKYDAKFEFINTFCDSCLVDINYHQFECVGKIILLKLINHDTNDIYFRSLSENDMIHIIRKSKLMCSIKNFIELLSSIFENYKTPSIVDWIETNDGIKLIITLMISKLNQSFKYEIELYKI